MHKEKRRGKEGALRSFHLSPRMRFARSFRLAAERESRLRAGSPGSRRDRRDRRGGREGGRGLRLGGFDKTGGALTSRVPSARRRARRPAGAPAHSPQIPIGAGPPSTCTASPHSNVT